MFIKETAYMAKLQEDYCEYDGKHYDHIEDPLSNDRSQQLSKGDFLFFAQLLALGLLAGLLVDGAVVGRIPARISSSPTPRRRS